MRRCIRVGSCPPGCGPQHAGDRAQAPCNDNDDVAGDAAAAADNGDDNGGGDDDDDTCVYVRACQRKPSASCRAMDQGKQLPPEQINLGNQETRPAGTLCSDCHRPCPLTVPNNYLPQEPKCALPFSAGVAQTPFKSRTVLSLADRPPTSSSTSIFACLAFRHPTTQSQPAHLHPSFHGRRHFCLSSVSFHDIQHRNICSATYSAAPPPPKNAPTSNVLCFLWASTHCLTVQRQRLLYHTATQLHCNTSIVRHTHIHTHPPTEPLVVHTPTVTIAEHSTHNVTSQMHPLA
eukprot:1161796-Pelagomonas_calceolata.AAC.5